MKTDKRFTHEFSRKFIRKPMLCVRKVILCVRKVILCVRKVMLCEDERGVWGNQGNWETKQPQRKGMLL